MSIARRRSSGRPPARFAQSSKPSAPSLLDLLHARLGTACNSSAASNPQPPYAQILSDVNDGYSYYDALSIDLSHRFSNRFQILTSYVWPHTIDNVDPGSAEPSPNES